MSPSSRRAWIEILVCVLQLTVQGSPSSRRAWIEMSNVLIVRFCFAVALLAEGVDRNCMTGTSRPGTPGSPSSRRAWIEIYLHTSFLALFMSPSSRRAWIEIS